MNFNIIYGKSGSGKSKYIYEDINNKIDTGKSIYLIVPEQANLTAEKRLFEYTNKSTLLNVEVLTLTRMATRVFDEININKMKCISKTGKSMLIYDILNREKDKLKFLGKTDKNVNIVHNMITEFKKHRISVEDLIEFNSKDKYMNLKIEDISLIYQKYQEKIVNNFIDENDILDILAENLNISNMFDNAIIYIDDFQGFTMQEYRVFEKLLNKVSDMYVTVCTNEFEEKTSQENDIFYFNKKFARKLIEIAETQKASIKKIYLGDSKRFKNDELKFLEENFNNYKSNRYVKDIENLKLFLADNPYLELEYVAKQISLLIKNEKYRYNEIGIVTKDIDGYSEDAKIIFEKYNIPLFIDTKKELNQNMLIKYILSLLEIYSKNWSYESVINYLKIGLNKYENEEIYEFENYCRKWGIRNSKWYKKEFNYEPINDKQEKLEIMRKEIIIPLLELKDKISSNRTVYEITKGLYCFLIDRDINKILDDKIKKIGNIDISEEYNTSYKILIGIFDELIQLFGNQKLTFEKYKELIQVGIKNSELGKIPLLQDQVVLGDTERSRSQRIRALFVIGINDGVFPSASREEGYLNDEDREFLKKSGLEIAKTSKDLLYEEEFNVYRTLTLPEEKLFLSYISSDKEGKSLRPSTLIKKIRRIYPNLVENRYLDNEMLIIPSNTVGLEEALKIYRKFINGEKISTEEEKLLAYIYNTQKESFEFASDGIRYTNLPQKIDSNSIRNLYGKTLRTSISKLENYRRCPFSFHLTYGLGLKEKDELKLEAIDTGSFMHEVIDRFFKLLDEKEENIKKISEERISEFCKEIIKELLEESRYYKFSSTAKFKLLTKRLEKVIIKSVKYIVYTLQKSDFEVLGHEVEFNNYSEFKPIQMSLFDDNKLELIGKIDRVDIGLANNKQYVRVIDYKSSIKKMDLNQVVSGLQIQLITYLDTLTEQTDYETAGLLYLGLIDNIVKASKNMSEEEIEAEIRKGFKMQGFVLADINVVKAMDSNLETNKTSNIIPISLNKEGEISSYKSNSLNADEFKSLQKAVKKAIKNISEEILKGRIDIKPYSYEKGTGCDFCNYKTICNFNTNIKGNEYDYISKYSKEYILEQLNDKKILHMREEHIL